MKITKKDCKNKLEINTENYLIRKDMEGEYRRNLFEKMSKYEIKYCKEKKISL